MDIKDIINSGDLELYVYGLLNEIDTKKIAELAATNNEIENEILSIEKSILNLSSSFSPAIPSTVFEKTKTRLAIGQGKVISLAPRSNRLQYLGWAASFILLLGIGYQYYKINEGSLKLNTVEIEKLKLQKSIVDLESKSKETESALTVIRDSKNIVVTLAGQTIAPNAFAKVYWNKEKQTVYVDASGLPEPPKGMVYQTWALKLNPLTPTSIGLLENLKTKNSTKIFELANTSEAEAFGITLEPSGGSKTPTLEKLYALGKV
ncbi:anti-sigma factor domain-containing protein [Flavobacterium sp.]|uniref:anti-sigma factor n=1 Tax=Flavobacterium sp. TaxID=239 RepID=UPI0037B613F7